MGFFSDIGSFFKDDVGGFFKQVPKRVVGAGIGAGVGSGLVDPSSLKKGSLNVPRTRHIFCIKVRWLFQKKRQQKYEKF